LHVRRKLAGRGEEATRPRRDVIQPTKQRAPARCVAEPTTPSKTLIRWRVFTMGQDKPVVPFQGGRHRPPPPVSRLQLLKWGLLVLAALSLLIAFLLAAFVIGLLLTVPLIVLGIGWLITWRGVWIGVQRPDASTEPARQAARRDPDRHRPVMRQSRGPHRPPPPRRRAGPA
jgi:hypothetical protein